MKTEPQGAHGFTSVKAILDRLVNASTEEDLKFIHGERFQWHTKEELLDAVVERDGHNFPLVDASLIGSGNAEETYLVRILTAGLDFDEDGVNEYPRMPYRGNAEGEYASNDDLILIANWIDAGCPD